MPSKRAGAAEFESLDTQTVQRRSTVEQDRVTLDNFFQDLPDYGRAALDLLLG
jgi:hypothetical protein